MRGGLVNCNLSLWIGKYELGARWGADRSSEKVAWENPDEIIHMGTLSFVKGARPGR
jgi:hypothetical protein